MGRNKRFRRRGILRFLRRFRTEKGKAQEEIRKGRAGRIYNNSYGGVAEEYKEAQKDLEEQKNEMNRQIELS